MGIMLKRWSSSFLLPFTVLLLSALLIWQAPELAGRLKDASQKAVTLDALLKTPFIFFSLCFLMGWRYGNLGLALSGLCLFWSYLAVSAAHTASPFNELSLGLIAVLLPLHFAVFSSLTNRWVITPFGLIYMAALTAEACLFALFFYFNVSIASFAATLDVESQFQNCVEYVLRVFDSGASPIPSAIKLGTVIPLSSLAISLALLLNKLLRRNEAFSAAFIGAIIASLLGSRHYQDMFSASIYFSAAGFILVASSVEVSFLRSHLDELTGLPARRSLNKALLNVGRRYTVAMIDIDHFKKFNDRFGHKAGDQALQKVASKMATLGGRARIFRYGGEEFTALFPGQTLKESLPQLEDLRIAIEKDYFVVRDAERRKQAGRAPNRNASAPKRVKITVSVGAASSEGGTASPEQVMRKADKKLYAAKKAGRNRVKS